MSLDPEVSQVSELQIYKVASTLDEDELAATFQRYAGKESGQLSRHQIVEYLTANPPSGDFETTVGEIRPQVAAAKIVNDDRVDDGEKEQLVPDVQKTV